MSFSFSTAVRDRVSLLIGLAGASGSGKSLSALKLARGLAGDDSKIAFIDTEAGRGKHYAPAPGETPGQERFGFQHGDLRTPFSPEAYMEAIAAADKAGFDVIVIDSFSHSWDGEGGLQDIHLEVLEQMVDRARKYPDFDEYKVRDRSSMTAWKEPKARHRRLVSRLLQCRAHLIICLRADEKIRMEQVEEQGRDGRTYKKTVITQPKDMPVEERWVPICEKRFPYELTLSLLLTPIKPGFPIPIKLQEQHKSSIPLDKPLSEDTGRRLAEWARGGRAAAPVDTSALEAAGAVESARGLDALRAWWKTVPATAHVALKPKLDSTWIPAAKAADAVKADAAKAEAAKGTAAA